MSIKEKMTLVRRLNREARQKKGIESESSVDKALQLLVDNDLISTSWNASGTEDRKFGIDRHLQLLDGTEVYLQIKSSKSGLDKAKQIFPHIPVIEVRENEDIISISNRIRGLIQAKLKGKF